MDRPYDAFVALDYVECVHLKSLEYVDVEKLAVTGISVQLWSDFDGWRDDNIYRSSMHGGIDTHHAFQGRSTTLDVKVTVPAVRVSFVAISLTKHPTADLECENSVSWAFLTIFVVVYQMYNRNMKLL